MPIEEMVEKITPTFTYQLHFISGEIEEAVRTKEDYKQFLIALYGGRTENREFAFDALKGVDLDMMRKVRKSWLLDDEVSYMKIPGSQGNST